MKQTFYSPAVFRLYLPSLQLSLNEGSLQCIGISLTQWRGFLFFPFGFHLLLLELHLEGRWPCIPISVMQQPEQHGDALAFLVLSLLSVWRSCYTGDQVPVSHFALAWTQPTVRLCRTSCSTLARGPDSGVFCTVWSDSLLSLSVQLITDVVSSRHQVRYPARGIPGIQWPLLLEISRQFHQAIVFFYDVMLRDARFSQQQFRVPSNIWISDKQQILFLFLIISMPHAAFLSIRNGNITGFPVCCIWQPSPCCVFCMRHWYPM